MTTTLFVVPLKKGKTSTYKAFIAECFGPRRLEYKSLLLRYGCNSLQMWIHTLNGTDYAMFTHDMSENAQELLQNWPNSTDPFDKWFNEQLLACYDIESVTNMPPQPTFIGALDARVPDEI